MKRLLVFERTKVLHMKSLWLCLGSAFVSVWLSELLIKLMHIPAISDLLNQYFTMAEPSAVSASLSAFEGGSFSMLFGIFAALYICDDFRHKTIRNVCSRGYSRTEVFFSKWLVLTIIGYLWYWFTCLVGFIAGFALYGKLGATAGWFAAMLSQSTVAIAYSSVFAAVSLLIGKTGGAIAVNVLVPSGLMTVLSVLQYGLEWMDIKVSVSSWWLDGASALVKNLPYESDAPGRCLLTVAVYTVAAFVLYMLKSRKKEL